MSPSEPLHVLEIASEVLRPDDDPPVVHAFHPEPEDEGRIEVLVAEPEPGESDIALLLNALEPAKVLSAHARWYRYSASAAVCTAFPGQPADPSMAALERRRIVRADDLLLVYISGAIFADG